MEINLAQLEKAQRAKRAAEEREAYEEAERSENTGGYFILAFFAVWTTYKLMTGTF